MKKSKNYKKGQKFGKWELQKYLGGGGNGEVWKCTDGSGNDGAIKLLKSVRPKPYARFLDESTVLEKNADVPGIIPMLDKHLPTELNGDVPFYVMPIAENAEEKLNGKTIEEKIDAILQVSETLEVLHDRGISHRDIKPANLLIYNNRFSLADFGLVDYPDKKDISFKNEEIGPKWTMAPEMRRESSKANGQKADIYSLAKTLWIILTGNQKGFDGQYSPASILGVRQLYKETYTTPIDVLLAGCTENNPDLRPTIDEFISSLQTWKRLNEDFHERNLEQWFEVQQKLFPTSFPKRVIWENINDIVNVLKVVCTYDSLTHVFIPGSGGMDLEDVRIAGEDGCIELDFQLVDIVKPKRLLFESFGYDPEWNYFRLELDELAPSGINDTETEDEEQDEDEHDQQEDESQSSSQSSNDEGYVSNDGNSWAIRRMREFRENREELSEIYPGEYDDYSILSNPEEYREQGYEIPDTARHVTRWLRGSFVIFNKRSKYDLTPSTYDGRHNDMSTDEFRDYIQRNIEHSEAEFNEHPEYGEYLDGSRGYRFIRS